MGLDIHTLQNPRYIGAIPNDDEAADEMYDRYFYAYVNPYFHEHADGHNSGFYDADANGPTAHFSYGGYSHLRAAICELGLGVKPDVVWDDFDSWIDCALAWLIYFSDCEGFIGPETSAIIAAGLIVLDSKPTFEDDMRARGFWMYDGFERLRDCFKAAAETKGFVVYG